ncbi:MAG: HD domain-containing protein [Lachnospiraceae bacterium]|nr:HD domain-containing protein [Lachnospiraceae bacterium]
MKKELRAMISELERDGRFRQERRYMQHGSVTVYEHSIHVADKSLALSRRLGWKIDEESLLRGALLHDYFLYDWHEKNGGHRLHGFHHPFRALANAREDYTLNTVEEDIIRRHMFPLTLLPPMYEESWIVCLTDKYCAVAEMVYPLYCRIRGRQFQGYGV